MSENTFNNHPFGARFFSFMLHPALLSLLVTLLIIMILPVEYPKYKIDEIENTRNEKDRFHQWVFLDDNAHSDFISTKINPVGNTGVTIRLFPSQKVQQWNFYGKSNFYRDPSIAIGDFDKNHQSEVYVFTQSNDSIFLHIISDFENQDAAFTNRFISKVRIVNGATDSFIVPAEMDDLNDDGYNELIFGIGTGHSVYPRKIYGYNIKNDTLYQSNDNLYSLFSILQADITGDGKNEFFPFGYATDNIKDSSFKYHDRSCWLTGFDRKLKPLFEPVEFPGRFGALTLHAINDKIGKTHIIGLYSFPAETFKPNVLFHLNSNGQMLCSINLPRLNQLGAGSSFVFNNNGSEAFAYVHGKDSVLFFDETLKMEGVLNPGFAPEKPLFYDLDGDGEKEWIFLQKGKDQLIITKERFKYPAILSIFYEDRLHTTLSFKHEPGKIPFLFINTGKYDYTLLYSQNTMYYWRFGIYGAIYLGLFLFALIIRKIQKTQLNRRYQAEKKITELQVKIIRNQLDPHFAMNAINSAVAAIQQNNTGKAEQHLNSFSRLYRHLLLTADKITCQMEEELEFTENYIKMEQTRFPDLFTFEKSITSEVDMGIEIPKMAIQSHVENAIKHGLRRRVSGGILKIELSVNDSALTISISDNGIGRAEAAKLGSDSTGKGNQVMEEYFGLFHKITGQKVHSETRDLFDEVGHPAGTCVRIFISLQNFDEKICHEDPKILSFTKNKAHFVFLGVFGSWWQ
jgi:hypothetical protein